MTFTFRPSLRSAEPADHRAGEAAWEIEHLDDRHHFVTAEVGGGLVVEELPGAVGHRRGDDEDTDAPSAVATAIGGARARLGADPAGAP